MKKWLKREFVLKVMKRCLQRKCILPVGILFGLLALLWTVSLVQAPRLQSRGGLLIFSDDFERGSPGEDYLQGAADTGWTAGSWRIEEGKLKAEKIHNAALWLKRPLPEKVRVEFDARALAQEGDVKCEIFGDGLTHQSGYILIHGGWNNSINIIARRDEHAEDRKEDRRCYSRAGSKRKTCVEPDVDYHWAVERRDDVVEWFLDGRLFLRYPDKHPVRGLHFAFNNWEAPVLFDNLRIYDLSK